MKSFHFIGVGGIGMSALAAGAAARGWQVSGSDRGADKPENAPLISALRAQGVKIYPQDGSRFSSGNMPEALVFSTAIEEDNPDLLAAGDIPRMHRSEFLRLLLDDSGKTTIAVTGSCGKSSVTAHITETLDHLGADPEMISGALSKSYRRSDNAGNYRAGNGNFLVFEADESDKSLLAYGADYAVILNIGTDHYEQDELVRVFGEFLHNIRRGAVLSRQVADALAGRIPEHLQIKIFDEVQGSEAALTLRKYIPGPVPAADCADGTLLNLPAPGRHTALNALAIRGLTALLGFDDRLALNALGEFGGVWRRNDYAGKTPSGAAVYDDYAHNPEKIISCLSAMRESASGTLLAVFQPHGYGPLGFMAGALFEKLEEFLQKDDIFVLMEPYYAGGTTSFSPHSCDVCRSWQEASTHPQTYISISDRNELKRFLQQRAGKGDVVVIMGARDNSLSIFARTLTL